MREEFLTVNYGYGFSLKDIPSNIIDKNSFIQFLQDNVPEIYFDRIITEFQPSSVDAYILALYRVGYLPALGGEPGLAGLLQEVLISRSGVDFVSAIDDRGDKYILYQPKYPWQMKEIDWELSTEKLDEIMTDVLSEFIADIPDNIFDFQTVVLREYFPQEDEIENDLDL